MSIKVGILGLAHGHVMSYGRKWIENPQWEIELVGGWDHDAGRRDANTSALGIKAYDTPEALLADVDAVVISSETSFHVTLTEMAAAAGKDIICYKPMALTLEEADRMVAAVEAAGVRFTLGYQMRVDPQNIKMKELVHDGTIGNICHAEIKIFFPGISCIPRRFSASGGSGRKSLCKHGCIVRQQVIAAETYKTLPVPDRIKIFRHKRLRRK